MVVGNAKDNGNDVTVKKPSKAQRHLMIPRIIKESPNIRTIGQLINRLNREFSANYPDYKYDVKKHQPLITGDLKELGIKPTRGKGFIFSDRAVIKEHTDEIKSILRLAKISEGNIISKALPMAVKVNGYGQALAYVLKKMYSDDIIDILILESSIIIFCPSIKMLKKIESDLVDMTKGKYRDIISRRSNTSSKNKPPTDEE